MTPNVVAARLHIKAENQSVFRTMFVVEGSAEGDKSEIEGSRRGYDWRVNEARIEEKIPD